MVGAGHLAPRPWRAPADDLYGITHTASAAESSETAVHLITRVLRDNAAPVDILTLGPLTDVADVLEADPGLRSHIGRVVAMAGAIGVPGNVDADPLVGSPEWNVWFAPAAMAAVLASGVELVLIPLDATNDVPVTDAFFTALAADHAAAGADLTFELLARNRFLTLGGQYFWDPLAAAFLEDPGVVELTEMSIVVRSDRTPDLGRTMRADDGDVVQVATAATPDRFARLFLTGLRRGPLRIDPFSPGGPLTAAYDGTTCRVYGVTGLRSGPTWAIFDGSSIENAQGVIVRLHPGATWQQVQAYAAAISEQANPPNFVDLITIPQLGAGIASIVTLPSGDAAIACAQTDQGVVTTIAFSEPFEISP